MYYKLNGALGISASSLGRPRRGRSLPKVFSKEEVKLILNLSRNLKHRLILWMIYSCGLRRSEEVDIRYVQELFWHKSSRTTEIYTHVSRRNLIAVRSPIDDMDLK